MRRFSLLTLLAFLLPLAASAAPSPAAPFSRGPGASSQEVAPGQIIVKVRPWLLGPTRPLIHGALGLEEIDYNPLLGVSLLSLPPGLPLEEAIAFLEGLPWVEYAEPNYQMRASLVPDDPYYQRFQSWYYELLGAPQAWDVTTGSPTIVVAVVDSGMDIQHPDLVGKIWINQEEKPDNGLDDDENGCVDDLHGCNFLPSTPNGDIEDENGHGTLIAGILAASGNNGQGVAGVAWKTTLMPVKVLNWEGIGFSWDVAKGITYAAQEGARIINLSFGNVAPNSLLEDATRMAHDFYGAIVVAAAGNEGSNSVEYPAAYP